MVVPSSSHVLLVSCVWRGEGLNYEWPISLLRSVEVWCRNFLWSGSIEKWGIPLVAWRFCCASINEGGLGLKQLVILNRSLLLIKRGWEIFSSRSEGCSFIHDHFWRNGIAYHSYSPSSIWPGVKKFWSVIQENARWLIGFGDISFWQDNFMGRPLVDFFASHSGRIGGLFGSVANFITNGSWDFPPLLQLHFPALCERISQVPISLDPFATDKLVRSSSSFEEFSAEIAFQFLRHPSPLIDWGKCLWSKFILPRMSLIVGLEGSAW